MKIKVEFNWKAFILPILMVIVGGVIYFLEFKSSPIIAVIGGIMALIGLLVIYIFGMLLVLLRAHYEGTSIQPSELS